MGDRLLAGRGAIVVGGSRGVGRAVARLLAALGAGVVVNGRDADAVWEVVCDIVRAGDSAIGFAVRPRTPTPPRRCSARPPTSSPGWTF